MPSALLEFCLVVVDERRPQAFVDPFQWHQGQRVWWGPGAERKANTAARALTRKLPAYHFCRVSSHLAV